MSRVGTVILKSNWSRNMACVSCLFHGLLVKTMLQKSYVMNRILRIVCLSLILTSVSLQYAAADTVKKTRSGFDWEPVMEAIIQVESEGDPKAVSGNSCGAMQITPILVKECNNILKKRNMKKRYTLNDRFSVEKSKEMFLLIQSHHNPSNNVEKAIRSWNGGIRYSVKRTQRYYNKVKKNLKRK